MPSAGRLKMLSADEARNLWSEVNGAPYNPDDTVNRAGLFLLMSLGRDNSVSRIATAAPLSFKECTQFKREAKRNGIFRGRKLAVDWAEEGGGTALLLDALCVAGLCERK